MIDPIYLEKHMSKIIAFEKQFSIVFFNKRLLLEALDHTALNSEKKKQYAIAGDALLDFILFDYLICKKEYAKGQMDCIRQHLNTDVSLSRIGKDMKFADYILFPESASKQEKEDSFAYYNDTIEALVYVIMKDQGLGTVYRFVVDHIISKIPKNEYRCKEN